MERKGSFARDWQLIKLSRRWQPYDIAPAILSDLWKKSPPERREAICDSAYSIGLAEGKRLLDRMGGSLDRSTLLESIFLAGGISCVEEVLETSYTLHIRKEFDKFIVPFTDDDPPAIAFISGVIHAILPGTRVKSENDRITVEIPRK